ncbi:hypothetical protein C6A87_015865 [Mycobacterium sp. ITM-2016-00317]|uniref:hypothetical protein n=1 Tax=Mycobacterium sp. ITM-2016-00317 TaxID=2099694 RepID=UPI000D40784F|nr:hypothetical protein [Mycobacterium sp. ITM-2016-00317]WNG85437.1 hypothetical protein C6A87_015865 [Mycobacterium sp. ITM-2016-00317]
MIEREGVDSVADLAAVGDAGVIRRRVQRYYDAGATDIVLNPLDPATLPPGVGHRRIIDDVTAQKPNSKEES